MKTLTAIDWLPVYLSTREINILDILFFNIYVECLQRIIVPPFVIIMPKETTDCNELQFVFIKLA